MKIITCLTGILVLCTLSACSQKERTLDQLSMEEKMERAAPFHEAAGDRVDPFQVVGNIYSVGVNNIGVYLIDTGEGLILVDSGVWEMAPVVIENVKQLGYNFNDVDIILSTHAHFDHVQAHAALRDASDARVMAMAGDAEALEAGEDLSPLGFEGWDPVPVERVLQHGDSVNLGNTTLVAHQIPGHTPGCTAWELDTMDEGEAVKVAIFGCRGPNNGVRLLDNPDFPDLVEQTHLGFERLAAMEPDIYLSNHPASDLERWGEAMMAGERPHPLLQQQSWPEMVAELQDGFQQRIDEVMGVE